MSGKILVIDDEPGVRFGIRDFLESNGYSVEEAGSCQEGEEKIRSVQPDTVIADYRLLDGNAIELLPRIKKIDADIPVIILTAHGSIDLAVAAIKEGAEHFLTKPIDLPVMQLIVERVLKNLRSRKKEIAILSGSVRKLMHPFLGTSKAIRNLSQQMSKLGLSDSPLLIQGETGTGKSVLARWLHDNGPRADEAFVDLNCASLSGEFLESELFGHEKGAYTGATSTKQGLLEIAHHGSIFLDEIGDMDLAVQAKLLKVVEDQRFRRMGDVRSRQVDVRLITATHEDINKLVGEKKFRQDLMYRINTITATVPPLRERKEDIPILAQHLMNELTAEFGREPVELPPEVEKACMEYPWPGNIRELRNFLERALIQSDHNTIELEDLPFNHQLDVGQAVSNGDLSLDELERRHIEKILKNEKGQVLRAAQRLGISRSSLYQKIKRYGIPMSK